ncbi:MAG: hypothetical protein M0T74_06735 [Desulfitobacterium hafniense]|nr:hypothetical protein [Desulfitobacterium hafniense]
MDIKNLRKIIISSPGTLVEVIPQKVQPGVNTALANVLNSHLWNEGIILRDEVMVIL